MLKRSKFDGIKSVSGQKRIKELEAQNAAAKASEADKLRQINEMVQRGPGYRAVEQSAQEKAAGVVAPGFEGVRDVKTGKLLDQYKSDAYAGEALQKLKGQAFAEGDSPWAKMQLEKQALEQSQGRDQAASSQAQALAQAQSNLMRQGGLSSGARTRMAMQGAKDMALAQQRVNAQGIGQRLGIQEQDLNRKQDLLGKFGDAESAANEKNIGRMSEDVRAGSAFDMERYGQQMGAYGAAKTAEAQRAAAGSGGKCFFEDSKVLMNDMTVKPISQIKSGEVIFAGGLVLASRSYYSAEGFELYDYDGVFLTGSHSVKECGEWKHVEDSFKAKKTNMRAKEVYTLVTENHFIVANKVVFSDDVETNENLIDEAQSLKALNKGA
jgi:hypothetical protein